MAGKSGINSRIVVRQAQCPDSESVGVFLNGLSQVIRYQRFLAPLRSVSPTLTREMVTVTSDRRVLLGLDGDSVVAHVMAARVDEYAAEVGIVVAEAYQSQGIGRVLMGELADDLRTLGITEVRCSVLSENRRTLTWVRRLLLDTRFERGGAVLTVRGRLPPQPP